MKLTDIKLNPDNPRYITDAKFTQLMASISDFPKMMRLRPMTINKDHVLLGGNMRYRACEKLGMWKYPTSGYRWPMI
jgi:ParB-like chromosome segregation protein Spo0J